jgi:hypothetical protein
MKIIGRRFLRARTAICTLLLLNGYPSVTQLATTKPLGTKKHLEIVISLGNRAGAAV